MALEMEPEHLREKFWNKMCCIAICNKDLNGTKSYTVDELLNRDLFSCQILVFK